MKHKVLLVLLLGIIISVSASAQKVTINLKQVKLEKVFSAITQQTGLTVAYSRTIVNPDRIVTVGAKNQELSKVLNDLFLGTNVNYEIGKTKIYLKEKVTDSEQQTSNANKKNISGRVVDEKGEPIIGASVMVQGSSLGTITNVDGRYTLANVPESSTITVSYIGYITVNYAATSRNLSQVVLREDSKTLEEVVVVGYGTQKKVNLTGAVAIVSGDELTTRSAANLSQLLQGSVPNMNVNFSSGRPGQGGSFNIRGVNSISADAAPLTIIDGIEGDINKVNPNDVESISVLKDASAAAIAASAFLELSGYVTDGKKYSAAAAHILKSLSSPAYLAEPGTNCNFILMHSVGSIPHGEEIDVPLIYADYYYLEALMRYKNM